MPNESSGMTAYARTAEEHRQRTEAHAREVLAKFGALAAEQGVPFEGRYSRTDAVDDAIVNTAEDAGCDLIVMASHGRRGLKRLLLGSETQQVLTHSSVPVLVLR